MIVIGQFARDRFAVADQDDLSAEVTGGRYPTFDSGFGRSIATHGIERDLHSYP